MMVVHTVQVGYHDGMGKHHEFYVALSDVDLRTFQKALTRAEKKASTLTRLVKKMGIQMD